MSGPSARRGLRYPVIFREEGAEPLAGSLTVDDAGLLLSGGAGGELREIRVPIAALTAVRTSHTASERLNGHPVLVLERTDAPPLLIAALGVGLLTELADLLGSLSVETDERVAVVLPLRPGSRDAARRLVAQGPPFEPESLPALRHVVYLEPEAVLFLFEGPEARRTVERMMRSPALWRAGLSWREIAAGRPYAADATSMPGAGAELLYSWPPSSS